MITDDKLKIIYNYYLANGLKKTATDFNLSHSTLERYIRKAKPMQKDLLSENKLWQDLNKKFSIDELKSIAKNETILKKSNTTLLNLDGDIFKIGVLSDLHIGSNFFHPQKLLTALDMFVNEKIDFVVICGDVVEGMALRDGHIYELTHFGYEQQKNYAIELLSKYKLKYYMIDGNHDRWYLKNANQGALIVKDICNSLDDAEFIGHDEGDIFLNGAKIKLWHGEDGNCFDDKTEILTSNGWKYFKDLNYIDEVATMTKKDHCFEWQRPTDIYIKDYDGDMIYFKSRTIDCAVTPNHNMWTRVSNFLVYRRKKELTYPTKSHIRLNTKWHKKTADDIYNDYSRQKWQFTKVCNNWIGYTPEYISIPYRESKNKGKKVIHLGNIPIDDIAELIAWYVTEGHIRKSGIFISQYKSVNPENYQAIIDLAERLKLNYGISKKCISLYSYELAEFLIKECGHLSRFKFLPKWLKNCSSDILQIVFETMIKGDGWISGQGFGYRSISKQLLSDFSEIAIKLGYSLSFCKDSVSISNMQVYPTVNVLPEKLNYKGKIYCCSVPNGLILVRRNGKILWSHNSYAASYRIQKIIEAFQGGEKPNVLICGHTHKYIKLFLRNIHAFGAGCIQMQSSWMRRKKLEAHPCFLILTLKIADSEVKYLKEEMIPFYC